MSSLVQPLSTAVLSAAIALAGCRDAEQDAAAPQARDEPSPNARILPAPLTSGAQLTESGQTSDAGPAGDAENSDAGPSLPTRYPEDQALAAELGLDRELNGFSLKAEFLTPDIPRAAKARAKLEGELLKSQSLDVRIDLGAHDRLVWTFKGPSLPLLPGSQLRSRIDRLGHVLVWPNASHYRVVAPGSLRALLEEGRADTAPLVAPKVTKSGRGKLLGLPVSRVRLETEVGEASVDFAALPGVAGAGKLLCRTLAELILAAPDTHGCEQDAVPLKAVFKWPGSGTLEFVVTNLTRRQDFAERSFLIPPPGARFKPGELPTASSRLLVPADEPALKGSGQAQIITKNFSEGSDLSVQNRSHVPQYLWVDGLLVGRAPPNDTLALSGLRPAKHEILLRDFLGTEAETFPATRWPQKLLAGKLRVDEQADSE